MAKREPINGILERSTEELSLMPQAPEPSEQLQQRLYEAESRNTAECVRKIGLILAEHKRMLVPWRRETSLGVQWGVEVQPQT